MPAASPSLLEPALGELRLHGRARPVSAAPGLAARRRQAMAAAVLGAVDRQRAVGFLPLSVLERV